MKSNSKLSYVLIIIAIVLCLGGAGFLGYNLFVDKTVSMINLKSMPKEDVLKWITKNNLENFVKYEYVYSDEVDDGLVVSQSLNENDKVTDNFTVQISKGSVINLNVLDYATIKDFESFIAQYPNIKVEYDGNKDETNSKISKFSKNSIDIKSDTLTVYLDSNDDKTVDNDNKDEKDSKDEKDDSKDENTGTKATIPNNLLGIKEEDFIKKLNDLGFKNLKKETTKYYSFNSKVDTIFSYDDGKFDTGKTINYAISLGDYPTSFKAAEYNNKTKADADALVKKYNDLNAHITFKTNSVKTTKDSDVNKLANCTCKKDGTKSILTCDLYSKEAATVDVTSYVGKSESEMKSELTKLGFSKFQASNSKYSNYASGIVLRNDTGKKKTTDTITYDLSLGQYAFNASEYNGKTLSAAQTLMNNYNAKGAGISKISTVDTEVTATDGKANGTVYECGYSANIITCKLAVMTYSIPNKGILKQQYSSSSYDTTVSNLKELFAPFTNVKYEKVSDSLGVGQIVNITVDGNRNYPTGNYKSNVAIVIQICNEQY